MRGPSEGPPGRGDPVELPWTSARAGDVQVVCRDARGACSAIRGRQGAPRAAQTKFVFYLVMCFFKKTGPCPKVWTAAWAPLRRPHDLRTPRNRNKSMFADDLEQNLSAQLILAAEIEHFPCGIRPAPPAGRRQPRRPSTLLGRIP